MTGDGRTHVPDDLERFGFDDPGERWLDRFRVAAVSEPLGCIGPYEILREVDRGGQGVVYCARQPGTGRRIAVKRLRAGSFATPPMRRRFEREIEIASSLAHPGIVNVFAVDVIDGQPTLAMQWVEGVPITRWARGRAVREILEMFRQVCDAVAYAHRRGVIHRDLKPSNILVERTQDGWAPRVLDFGLAKLERRDENDADGVTDDFVGTLAFAAPEQVAGRADDVDVRADVYALGVVLYLMLTRTLPCPVDGPLAEAVHAVRHRSPRAPSALEPAVGREVDAIVLKALAKSADERYQSVAAFEADVARFLCGRPVEAHPQSRAYLLRTFVRRHRLACAFAATTALLVLAFTAALLVLVNEALDARAREAEERRVAEQVSAFLQDTLSFAGPARSGGDVTVLEMMEEASRRAAVELEDRPRVAAEIHFTIGSTYANLWLWRESIPPLRRALELSRRAYGDGSEHVARCLTVLGRSLSNRGDPAAVAMEQEGLAIRRALYGEEHELVAESKMRLGYALYRAADPPRFPEAERMLDDALATYRRTVGPGHRDVASCLHNYAFLRLSQNRLDEAETLYAEALEILRRIGDRADPFYIECMHGYTALLIQLGRYQESIDQLEILIPLVRDRYGEARTTELYRRSAAARQALADFDGAARLDQQYLARTARELAEESEEHADTLTAIARLADRPGEALPGAVAADEILAAARSLPDALQMRVLRGLLLFAGALRERGDLDEAEAVFRGIVAVRTETTDGAPDVSAARGLEALGDVALERGDDAAAETRYREARAQLTAAAPAATFATARLDARLGACFARRGAYAEAEPLLLAFLDRLEERYDDRSRPVQRTLRELAMLYEAWGRTVEAEGYWGRVEREGTKGPRD